MPTCFEYPHTHLFVPIYCRYKLEASPSEKARPTQLGKNCIYLYGILSSFSKYTCTLLPPSLVNSCPSKNAERDAHIHVKNENVLLKLGKLLLLSQSPQ